MSALGFPASEIPSVALGSPGAEGGAGGPGSPPTGSARAAMLLLAAARVSLAQHNVTAAVDTLLSIDESWGPSDLTHWKANELDLAAQMLRTVEADLAAGAEQC